MKITSSTVSLTVRDTAASAAFFTEHLGFRELMAAEGFVALGREDAGVSVALLAAGNPVLPEHLRDRTAEGTILAFVVDDLAAQEARLRAAGVPFTVPLREEPWGERLFVVEDPNGLSIELVEWADGDTGPTSA